MDLLCHINDDQDLLEAWLAYYRSLGVGTFHFVVHGPVTENQRLFELRQKHPILIHDVYEGEFRSEEKQLRLNAVLPMFRGKWVLLVDSDEFVELPYRTLQQTVRVLETLGADVLYAPLLQRLTVDGHLDTPDIIADPFVEFPLCSVDLCLKMGVSAYLPKHPLFRCGEATAIQDGGNHHPAQGVASHLSPLQGVTHHFKWRKTVLKRLETRANSGHTWRHQSKGFQDYLVKADLRLPLDGAFPYSRAELFRRGLLRKADCKGSVVFALRNHADSLPPAVRSVLSSCYHAFQRTFRGVQQDNLE